MIVGVFDVELPTSSGAPRPGVDLNDSAMLLDLTEDSESHCSDSPLQQAWGSCQ
jgi:hypothetical protein